MQKRCMKAAAWARVEFAGGFRFPRAYVNEENPMIDKLLREALDTRIVNRFLG